MKFKFVFIIFLFLCSTIKAQFAVKIQFLKTVTADLIEIKITTQNVSGKIVNVSQPASVDYKRNNILALGNYIIQIEKFEDNEFKLFPPSADIDPMPEIHSLKRLAKGKIIFDTVQVLGSSFRDAKSNNGFPQGKYRIRVLYNPIYGTSKKLNYSNWLNFEIS